jgi:hypothetical protein
MEPRPFSVDATHPTTLEIRNAKNEVINVCVFIIRFLVCSLQATSADEGRSGSGTTFDPSALVGGARQAF